MKIAILGDPHGKIPKLKNADLILCTGDLGKADLIRSYFFKYTLKEIDWHKVVSKKEVRAAYEQLVDSSIEVIRTLGNTGIPTLLVLGNAEMSNREIEKLNKDFEFKLRSQENEIKKFKNIKVINKKIINFKGLKIAGLSFFRKEKSVKKFLSKAKNLDILLIHNPPYKILDTAINKNLKRPKHLGSKIILSYIKSKKPKYVVCGHIHEAKGVEKLNNTTIINAGQKSTIYL
ncbi:metallophosphoesterase [Candidatus Woesearchaeota archaeon]|nr:metallophosphoesterase [Candidatus Woesearchaeota archaeon]